MDRRRVVWLLALGVASPRAVAAQPAAGKVYRIGFLGSQSASAHQPRVEAFSQGFRDLGYVDGRNIVIEFRWAEGAYDQLPGLARELVGLNPDLIVASGGVPSALAVKAATATIPVVFFAGDPVGTGIVASLARPGGNLTGLNVFAAELNAKRLELLKAAVPGATRVAVLWNPGMRPGRSSGQPDLPAQALGLRLRFVEARGPVEIDTAFDTMVRERIEALLVSSDPMFDSHRRRIVDRAAHVRLPAIYQWREYVEQGGLLSYAPSLPDLYRRAATYVDKILRGARPADLPVEQPSKFELVVNLKTAKSLGITIPRSFLARADEIIE